jgi:hypothetical protein
MLLNPPGTLANFEAAVRAANDNRRLRVVETAPMWVPLLFTFEPQPCCICRQLIVVDEPLYGLTRMPAEGWLQQFRHAECSGPADERDGRVLR